jgi:crossover junction endodeoxyribonuclease RuvC
MRVLGIDPGTRVAAWAIYDAVADTVMDYREVVFSKKSSADERLKQVPDMLAEIIPDNSSLDLVAYEKMFSMGNNADAPLAVFAWLIRIRCLEVGVPFIEIPHTSVYKEVVGRGSATKEEVQVSLSERFGEPFPSTDVTDAIAIAIAGVTFRQKEKKPRTRKASKASRNNTGKKP